MNLQSAVAAFVVATFVTGAIAQTNQTTPAGAARPAVKAEAKAAPKPAGTAAKTLEGTIKEFECGDNCYLTITLAKGGEESGLCEAKACVPWFENQAMPPAFVGRRVRVTTAVGVQRDGSGKVMGKMTSFKMLEFLK